MCVRAKSLQLCLTLLTPWTVAHQAPLSMGFSRQEYWSMLPCPSSGDFPDPGIKPASPGPPALAGGFLPLCHLTIYRKIVRISEFGSVARYRGIAQKSISMYVPDLYSQVTNRSKTL